MLDSKCDRCLKDNVETFGINPIKTNKWEYVCEDCLDLYLKEIFPDDDEM